MYGKSALADLLRASAIHGLDPAQERAAARLLGLVQAGAQDLAQCAPAQTTLPPAPSLPAEPAQTPMAAAKSDETPEPEPSVESDVETGEDAWGESLPSEPPAPPAWLGQVGEFPRQTGDWINLRPKAAPPLLRSDWARQALAEILSYTPNQGPLDIARLIHQLALHQPIKRLTRLRRPRLANSAQVLVDNGDGMAPFRDDQRDLLSRVRQILPRSALRVLYFEGLPRRVRAEREILDVPYTLPPRGSAVLLLTDLGLGGDAWPQNRDWCNWAVDLAMHRCKLATLMPYPPQRLPAGLRESLGIIPWERPQPPPFQPWAANLLCPLNAEQRRWAEERPEALHLALCLSLAARIEPALLRAVRHRFIPSAPAAAEADLWHSPLIDDRSRLYVSIEPSAAEGLRGLLRQYPERLAAIRAIIKELHAYLAPLAQMEEDLLYLATAQPPDFRAQIDALVRPLLVSLTSQPGRRESLASWADANLPRLPSVARTPAVANARAIAHRVLHPHQPLQIDARDIRQIPEDADWTYFWQDITRAPVGISFDKGTLSASDGQGGAWSVEIPDTSPRIIDIFSHAKRIGRLQWIPGGSAQLRVSPPITIQTLYGTRYLLGFGRAVLSISGTTTYGECIQLIFTIGLQDHASAIAEGLSATYPGLWAEPLRLEPIFAAMDDRWRGTTLVIVLFGVDPLPKDLREFIQPEINEAITAQRATRILPVSTRADSPRPPSPLNYVKALPYLDNQGRDLARIVRRVGALLGLWLRGVDRKVFVSHRQSDGKVLAAQVAQYLKDNGYNAWLDAEQLRGAEIVQQEIERRVADAHLFLLLDTPQAKDSEWLWKEVDAAISGFVPIFSLILRPAGAGAESARSDFLQLNELHHQSIQVSLSADGSCEPLTSGALEDLLAAAEDYMCRILQLQTSLVTEAREAFMAAGFDWQVLDNRRGLYLSTKHDDFGASTRILSYCSTVSPTFHQTVKAFQAASIPDPPCNFRLFLHAQPLARPLLARLTSELGFRDDPSLRILDIASLAKFLRPFRTEEDAR